MGPGGTLQWLDAGNGLVVRSVPDTCPTVQLALAPDGARLVTGDASRVRLWDLTKPFAADTPE